MAEQKLIRTCSIWRALEAVGDTPILLILEASWLGARRFDEFRSRTGLLKALISDRLKRLASAGILEKRLYTNTPPRFDYVMTQKGRDLYWSSLMLLRWERLWGKEAGKINLTLRHKTCGAVFTPEPLCAHCLGDAVATEVTWTEGPGVGWMAPIYSRRRQQRDSASEKYGKTSLFDEAAQIMGDRWASLILRSIFTGERRFDEILKDTAIATNILSERLSWLTSIKVIRQHQYNESPARHEYRLTQKGIDYYPVLLMLLQWGDKYYVSPEGPPLILHHKPCGRELEAIVACSECKKALTPTDVEYEITERKTRRKKALAAAL